MAAPHSLRIRTAVPPLVELQSLVVFSLVAFFALATELLDRLRGRASGPLSFVHVWSRHCYARVRDCWEHETASAPAARSIDVDGRSGALNFGSYNYLGLERDREWANADVNANADADSAQLKSLDDAAPAHASYERFCAALSGEAAPHQRSAAAMLSEARRALEMRVAEFVGTESALAVSTGFATNLVALRTVLDCETLVLSDELAHTSIVAGCRLARCTVRVFKHNSVSELERELRRALVCGRNDDDNGEVNDGGDGTGKRHRAFSRIVVVVEGVYSMEGDEAPLFELVALKRRYPFLLYVDEAHSIGALGESGRGACEHAGVSPRDVDVLVGTFSKAFSSVGGYVAGSRALVEAARSRLAAHETSGPARPNLVACVHIAHVLGLLSSARGRTLVARLHSNARLMRTQLRACGLRVLGAETSAVIPILVYHPCRFIALQRRLLKRGIAVTVVGYPATPVLGGRARLCVSAAHTREDIERAVTEIVGEARALGIDYDA